MDTMDVTSSHSYLRLSPTVEGKACTAPVCRERLVQVQERWANSPDGAQTLLILLWWLGWQYLGGNRLATAIVYLANAEASTPAYRISGLS